MSFGIILKREKQAEKKKLGYYVVKNIDNSCYITITVSPKEYFEVFKNQKMNKKHKGIKKGSHGMEFNNFAGRIKSLLNLDTFQKPPATYKEVSRFTDFQGEMVKKTVQKTEFSQLNDKGFYFHDGIMSLPYGHQNLKEIDDFKKEKGQKIEKYFWEKREKLLCMEKRALKNTPRLYLYHQILMSQPKIFDIKQKGNFESQNKKLIRRNTKDNSIRRMDEIKYMYDGKLEGNILDVGRTGCGKNTFVQHLGKNKMFGDVKEVYWMSNIELSKAREENIRDCFVNQIVKFDYPNNVEEFDDLLQAYRL